jgi:hypothetical protein
MEIPRSQGRKVEKKALVTPAPNAAANPNGRQQAIVATELRIAANYAEIPDPDFMAFLLAGLGARLAEPNPKVGDQPALIPHTNGKPVRHFDRSAIPPLHPVR